MAMTNLAADGLAASARRGEYASAPYRRPCSGCGSPHPLQALCRVYGNQPDLYYCGPCHTAWLAAEERAAVRAEGLLEPTACAHCRAQGQPLTYARCRPCYVFWRRHGYDREVPR